jgi:DNA-binding MarR family transcriptional regulator
MNPFESLIKLVEERGSAAVLIQHVEFIKSQHEASLRECVSLRAQLSTSHERLADSTVRIDELEAKNAELEAKLHELDQVIAAKTKQPDGLSDEAVQALEFLVKADGQHTVEWMAMQLQIEIGKARFHVDELRKKDFVKPTVRMANGTFVTVTPAGREFYYRSE